MSKKRPDKHCFDTISERLHIFWHRLNELNIQMNQTQQCTCKKICPIFCCI